MNYAIVNPMTETIELIEVVGFFKWKDAWNCKIYYM